MADGSSPSDTQLGISDGEFLFETEIPYDSMASPNSLPSPSSSASGSSFTLLPPGTLVEPSVRSHTKFQVVKTRMISITIYLPAHISYIKMLFCFQQKRKLDPVDEQLLKALKDNKSEDDEWDKFCSSLAPKLRKLSSKPEVGTLAQLKILQVIYDLESQETSQM